MVKFHHKVAIQPILTLNRIESSLRNNYTPTQCIGIGKGVFISKILGSMQIIKKTVRDCSPTVSVVYRA